MLRKKKREVQPSFWIPRESIQAVPSIPFWDRVNVALEKTGFGDSARELCAPYYAPGIGAPSVDPEVFFKMLMVGFMEGVSSNRGIAARCADSLSVRHFLGYGLTETTPDHSTLTVIRDRFPEPVFRSVFELTLKALREAKLLKGRHLGIDSTTVEANAAMRSLMHRFTGETYLKYVQRLAKEAGVDPRDDDAVRRFDATREGKKMSNEDWVNPHDPDARIARMKDKTTNMAYQQEHVTDLESGAIVDVRTRHADSGEADGLADRIIETEGRLNRAIGRLKSDRTVEDVTADKGYHKLDEIVKLQRHGQTTIIPEAKRTRNEEEMTQGERRAYRRNARSVRTKYGKKLKKKRCELTERSFAHTMEAADMRRTRLRGLEKNQKRSLMGAMCFNFCLFFRNVIGFGTVRQFRAATKVALAFFEVILRLLQPPWKLMWACTVHHASTRWYSVTAHVEHLATMPIAA
jgi:transposase